MNVKVAQSCLTLCEPMDYTVQGIHQARILEWVAFPFSRGSSNRGIKPRLRQCRWILYQLNHTVKGQKKQPRLFSSVSSVAQSCPTLCDPMDCSTPGLLAYHKLPEFTQAHVHWVSDAIQLSHPLPSPSPLPSIFPSISLFKWFSSSHQVAKVLEFQLQHQSFQWIFRTDFL